MIENSVPFHASINCKHEAEHEHLIDYFVHRQDNLALAAVPTMEAGKFQSRSEECAPAAHTVRLPGTCEGGDPWLRSNSTWRRKSPFTNHYFPPNIDPSRTCPNLQCLLSLRHVVPVRQTSVHVLQLRLLVLIVGGVQQGEALHLPLKYCLCCAKTGNATLE